MGGVTTDDVCTAINRQPRLFAIFGRRLTDVRNAPVMSDNQPIDERTQGRDISLKVFESVHSATGKCIRSCCEPVPVIIQETDTQCSGAQNCRAVSLRSIQTAADWRDACFPQCAESFNNPLPATIHQMVIRDGDNV